MHVGYSWHDGVKGRRFFPFCHCERIVIWLCSEATSSKCRQTMHGDEVASSFLLAMTMFYYNANFTHPVPSYPKMNCFGLMISASISIESMMRGPGRLKYWLPSAM